MSKQLLSSSLAAKKQKQLKQRLLNCHPCWAWRREGFKTGPTQLVDKFSNWPGFILTPESVTILQKKTKSKWLLKKLTLREWSSVQQISLKHWQVLFEEYEHFCFLCCPRHDTILDVVLNSHFPHWLKGHFTATAARRAKQAWLFAQYWKGCLSHCWLFQIHYTSRQESLVQSFQQTTLKHTHKTWIGNFHSVSYVGIGTWYRYWIGSAPFLIAHTPPFPTWTRKGAMLDVVVHGLQCRM